MYDVDVGRPKATAWALARDKQLLQVMPMKSR